PRSHPRPDGALSLVPPASERRGLRVWVDCTAAAHPLVLKPIVERIEARGHEVFVTAREYGQTLGVLDRLGMSYEPVGRHAGASSLKKGVAVAGRSAALARLVWRR